MTSLVLAQILCILLVGGLRFGSGAVLAGAGRGAWGIALLLAGLALALCLARDLRRGRAPWDDPGRILLWLVFPGAAALHWGLGQAGAAAGLELGALALILGLVLGLLAGRRGEWAGRELDRRAWLTAARWLLPPTALVLGLGFWPGSGLADARMALLTYPLYGLAQLLAALVLPWTQAARDADAPGRRVVTIALLFALVHWPNPFATAVTFLGMLLWAAAWRAGSALLPLALSMGIMATVVTQALPVQLTGHMRIGAGAVLAGRERARAARLDLEAARINVAAGWVDARGLADWLARALPEATGAPVDSALVAGTAALLERMHREYTLRWIFDSGEFRDRHRVSARLQPTELRFFESTFVPFHAAHAGYVSLVARGATMPYRAFVRLAYQELLGRAPNPGEYRHWPAPVTVGTRATFLRRVLDGDGSRERELRHWHEPDDPQLRRRLRERPAATPR